MIILGKGTSYEIQGAYRIGMALCAESAILGKGRRYLGGLEQHLPDVFVRRVEELSQHLVFGRVWSPVSSTDEPQDRPFSFQEVSRMGMPDRNSGAATQLVSCGSVM